MPTPSMAALECASAFLSPRDDGLKLLEASLACTSPAVRSRLEQRPCGLTIACHNIRVVVEGGEGDDEEDVDTFEPIAKIRGRSIDTSFEVKTDGRKPSSVPLSATPRKACGAVRLGQPTSMYADDHCRLRILERSNGQHAWSGSAAKNYQPEYEVSLAFSVHDSVRGEHQLSFWRVKQLVATHGMFLRHAGFRGRGCHTNYVLEVLRGVHDAQGSLLSLELSDMWFFTIFLEHLGSTTSQLVELQHLTLQNCHVFPTMDETVGELLRLLPSLQSLTLHQFDFTAGRAKPILEAASDHPCLRHINLNDSVFRTTAQNVIQANVKSIRRLESFHVNHLPDDFWAFEDFFAYKTNLRILQLSYCQLNEASARDVGHCLNVAVMLEELILDHCGLTDVLLEKLFPCIRRGGQPGTSSMLTNSFSTHFDCDGATPIGPLVMRSRDGAGLSATDTSEEGSRRASPAPQLTEEFALGGRPPGHQSTPLMSSMGGGAGGLGVNPFFAPCQSPLLLLPLSSSFAGPHDHVTDNASPYRSAMHPAHAIGMHGPAFGGQTICATLPHLRVLNLSDNLFGLSGLSQLAAPLGRMQVLEQLYLAGCGITGENVAEILFSTLDAVCGGLYVLDLSRNNLGDRAVLELCQMNFFGKLSSNAAEIFLSEVGIEQVGVCAVLNELSHRAEWLTLLDLSVNGWGPASPLSQNSLSNTHNSNNGVTLASPIHVDPMAMGGSAKAHHDRVHALTTFLSDYDGQVLPIAQLKLSYSLFSADDWVEVLRGISRSDCPAIPLEVLQLSSLHVRDDFSSDLGPSCVSFVNAAASLVIAISDTFGATLTSLDLSRNALGDDVVTDILLCHCDPDHRGQCISCRLCRLTSLQLRKTSFSKLTLGHNADTQVTSLVAMTELDLSGNSINCAAFAGISKHVLRHQSSLQRLDVSQNVLFRPSLEIVKKYPLDELTVSPVVAGEKSTETPADDEPAPAADKKSKKNKSATNTPEEAAYLSMLRKRRLHVISTFFQILATAVEKCRWSLRRIKLDGNGLNVLHLQDDLSRVHPAPPCGDTNLLLGPLGAADWRQGDATLAALGAGTSWSSYLLFSIHITSS